jgi:hypothetical protein
MFTIIVSSISIAVTGGSIASRVIGVAVKLVIGSLETVSVIDECC